jgi:cytochrome c
MDSFEWNKIIGALLGTALFVVGLHIVVTANMKPHPAAKPGMEVAIVETTGPAEAPVAEAAPDWGTVLPTADVAAGEKIHTRCLQCHDFANGGPDKIGPNLYGILGAHHAHRPSFTYSTAMKGLAEKTWGYDELDAFLKNPKGAVPGTKMAFAGLSKVADRVNLIAYLRTLSDSPLAIPAPKPAAAPAPAEATPATPTDGSEPAGEVQAPPPGSTPAAPGATTPPAGATAPAPAPGTPAPATPTTTTPGTTPAPATPAPTTPPAPAKPAGGGH